MKMEKKDSETITEICNDIQNNKDNKFFKTKYGMSRSELQFRYGLWGGFTTRLDEHGSYLYWPMRNHGRQKVKKEGRHINFKNLVGPGYYVSDMAYKRSKPKSRKAYIGKDKPEIKKKDIGRYCPECLGYNYNHTQFCIHYKGKNKCSTENIKNQLNLFNHQGKDMIYGI